MLTPREEQVMLVIWTLERALLKDIYYDLSLAQVAFKISTVANVVNLLKHKEFIGVEAIGRNNYYYPLVKKQSYCNQILQKINSLYYDGDYSLMMTNFLAAESDAKK